MGSKAQQQRPHTAFSNSDHELRLQELWKLSQRQQGTEPGPGHYKAVPASAFTRRSPHRPTQQPLDGPFPLQPGQVSTRAHNLDRFLLLRDSGLGPAAYDQGSSKDALARRAAATKIGTSRRVTSAVGPNQVCLSLSRSLAAGLDWRQQLTHAEIQQHLTATATAVAAGWAASPRTLAAGATCSASGCRLSSAKPAAAAAADAPEQHADSANRAGGEQQQQQQQQQQNQQQPDPHEQPEGSNFAAGMDSQEQTLAQDGLRQARTHQQQQQQQCLQEEQLGPVAPPGSTLQQQQQYAAGGSSWLKPGVLPPDTNSRRARSARNMPWQLAASIQHHEQVIQAMQAQVELQQQQQQQLYHHQHQQPPVQQELEGPHEQVPEEEQQQLQGSHLSRFYSQEQAQRQHEQQHQPTRQQRLASAPAARPLVVVMQQQEVVQHQSAARAATAVQQLAVRRQQWEQLSGLRPPPYPVFLPDAPPGTKL